MTSVARITAPDVTVTITAHVAKLCPVLDEIDLGKVTITYRTAGAALELHALANFLTSYQARHLSHEEFTHQLATELDADVRSNWTTADMEVECHAVPRQPIDPEGP